MKPWMSSALLFAAMNFVVTAAAVADPPPQAPTAEELVRSLKLPLEQRGVDVSKRAQTGTRAGSVDLYIGFEYNSAALAGDAPSTLRALADAMASPELASSRFLIAGHTDATGSDQYNAALSERRARAVANFLTVQSGIDPARLTVLGRGERELLDPNDPSAGINRRVEIRNLGAD